MTPRRLFGAITVSARLQLSSARRLASLFPLNFLSNVSLARQGATVLYALLLRPDSLTKDTPPRSCPSLLQLKLARSRFSSRNLLWYVWVASRNVSTRLQYSNATHTDPALTMNWAFDKGRRTRQTVNKNEVVVGRIRGEREKGCIERRASAPKHARYRLSVFRLLSDTYEFTFDSYLSQ